MQILKLPMILSLPDRWISVLVTSSGTICFSPAMREPSSIVGGTFCGGAGGGGGGGGGGAPTTPLMSPPTTPPATPPSSPPSSPSVWPTSSIFCGSFFSILTGWTMSLTLTFFGWSCWVCGFAPPLGGGGGGGGGGATARSTLVLGRSSISISQID